MRLEAILHSVEAGYLDLQIHADQFDIHGVARAGAGERYAIVDLVLGAVM